MKLDNLDLLSLQTGAMKEDKTIIALSIALNKQIEKIVEETSVISIYNNIDNLDEVILDMLAYDLDITWYDSMAPIDVKRKLIKTGVKINKLLGTPHAVEEVIKMHFGDGLVQEWFEYGGEPFMFKVVTSNPSVTQESADKFIKILNCVKNKRSHLETILISLTGEMSFKIGSILHVIDKIQIRQVG